MKEPSFADMSLERLLDLQKIWECQAKSAYQRGHLNLAASLIAKLDLIAPQIEILRKENLNDLFA